MGTIEIRTATEEDWDALFRVDGRNFGFAYTPEDQADGQPTIDLSRFRLACDGSEVVGIAGSFALDVTLPGGTTVPMGGVTWVSVAATHRRQGLLRRLMDAVHDDIDERGEPLATLSASEAGIYERFGYGAASRFRVTTLETRGVDILEAHRPAAGVVRFMETDEAATEIPRLWEIYRRQHVSEVSRSAVWHGFLLGRRAKPEGGAGPTTYLRHPDGYAVYRVAGAWNEGFPAHELRLIELVATTPEAHAALWHTLLNVDLVRTITSRAVIAEDDPLPYLLDDPRALRTVALNDGIWVNIRDVSIAFGARTYATEDRLVVEVDGKRWAIEGGPDGGSCKAVRSKPDLTMTQSALGALLYGGVRPSQLAAGRRLTARTDDVMRRADLFFPMAPAPHCQTHY